MRLGMDLKLTSPHPVLAAGPVGPFNGHATLGNDLVSAWPLSTDGDDAHGSNDLTNNNVVTFVPLGPSGVVADFVAASSEYLSVSTPASMKKGFSRSVAFWYYNGDAVTGGLSQCDNSPTHDEPIWLIQKDTDAVRAYGGRNVGFWATTGSLSIGWHFVVLTQTTVGGNASKFYVDGVQVGVTSAAAIDDPADFDDSIYVGSAFSGATTTRIARYGGWGTDISAATVLSLFNAGKGKSYADLTTAEKVGLVSYWNLDEVSGNRADSHGSNTLTDNNTVGSFITGPSGVVAGPLVPASSESLSTAANPLSAASAATINFWVEGVTTGRPVSIDDAIAPNRLVSHIAATGDWVIADTTGAVVVANAALAGRPWTMVTLTFDGTEKVLRVYFDGVLQATSLALAGTVAFSAAVPFRIGGDSFAGTPGNFSDGRFGRAGVWSAILPGSEITSLFNSGHGKSYADLTTAEKVGLVSYWNLDEVSSNRADSHGSNTLTDNNTVGYTTNSYPANMPGTVANFVAASSQFFDSSPALVASPGVDFSVAIWVKSSSLDADRSSIILENAWPNQVQFSARSGTFGTGGVNVLVSSGAGFVQGLNDALVIHDGSWHLLLFTFTDADGLIRTYVDNVQGNNSGSLGAPHYAVDALLRIGAGTALLNYDGNQSSALMAGRVWTPTERADLFNSGNGLFY